MLRKWFLLCLALLLIVAPAGSAFAQEDNPYVTCGDLPAEDCDIITASSEAMLNLTSYSSVVDFGVSLTDLPSLPQDLSFSFTSDGTFALDPEITKALLDMQRMGAEEMTENMAQMFETIADLYFTLGFDMVVDVSMSEDLTNLIAQSAGTQIPDALTLAMRMTEGYFYLNLDELAAAMPEAEGLQGWIGFDIGTLMSDSMQAAAEQLEAGGEAAQAMGASMAMTAQQQVLMEAAKDYVTVTRLEDAEVDGTPVAQFNYSFDAAGFIGSPEFNTFLMDQLRAQMEMNPSLAESGLTPENLDMVGAMLPMMGPMLLSGLTWEITTSIGLDDGYQYGSETHIVWDLSGVLRLAQMPSSGQPAFELHMTSTNSDFDSAPAIEAPADATIIPLEQLQGAPVMS
jgi:hypothetical protein